MSLFCPVSRKHVINCVVDLLHYDVFFATEVQDMMWIMEHVHGFDCVAIHVRTLSLVGWRVFGWSRWFLPLCTLGVVLKHP